MSGKGVPLSQSKFYQRAKNNTSVRAPPTPSEPSPVSPPIVGIVTEEAPRTDLVPKNRSAQDLFDTLNKGETKAFLPKTTSIDPQWYNRLVPYLMRLLKPISTDKELEVITSPKQEKMWRVNFTHSSSNYNKGENYEIMEKVGDGVMRVSFINYLYNKYPHLDESEISNLAAHYLSKPNQSPIAIRLGLQKFLIIEINIDTGINEDLLEALFGTLFTIVSNSFDRGKAYDYTYKFLEYIYENIYKIDLSNRYGHPKSQVTQAIRGMQWGNLLEKNEKGEPKYVIVTESVSEVKVTLYFPDEAMKYFKKHNIKMSRILATGTGNTKKVASDAAYSAALKLLTNINGEDYIALSRQDRLINNAEISGLYKKSLELAKSQGYDNIKVVNLKSYRNKEVLSLQGIDRDGRSHLLLWVEGPTHTDVQKMLFNSYIQAYSK